MMKMNSKTMNLKTLTSPLAKFLIVAGAAALLPAAASAAALTCTEIQTAHAANKIVEKPFTTYKKQSLVMQLDLLRKTVVLSGSLTEQEAMAATAEELLNDYDPIFKNLVVGETEFQVVDISLGDNPFIFLFNFDAETFSGVRSDDGSISIDGTYCETDSDIF